MAFQEANFDIAYKVKEVYQGKLCDLFTITKISLFLNKLKKLDNLNPKTVNSSWIQIQFVWNKMLQGTKKPLHTSVSMPYDEKERLIGHISRKLKC